MDKIEDFIDINYKNSNTAFTYKKRIQKFIKEYNNNADLNDLDVINNEFFVKDYIDTKIKKITTKQSFVSTLFSIYKNLHKKGIEINEELFEWIKQQFDILSEECKKIHINKKVELNFTYKDLYNHFLKMKVNTPEYIYMATLIYLPCRRLDWQHAMFIKENDFNPDFVNKELYNFVIINNDNTISLEFYNFKTRNKGVLPVYKKKLVSSEFTHLNKAKKYWYFNPEKLGEILINYYKEIKEQRFILTDKFDGFTPNTCTNWVKKILKKFNANSNNIRKLCVSTVMNNAGLYMTTVEKKEFAIDMGQTSIETQDTYREVPDMCNEEEDSEEEIEEEIVEKEDNKTIDKDIQTDNIENEFKNKFINETKNLEIEIQELEKILYEKKKELCIIQNFYSKIVN